MKGKVKETKENIENMETKADIKNLTSDENTPNEEANSSKLKVKLKELKQKLETKEKELQNSLEKFQRLAAEFDNFKKRTAREKEQIYKDSVVEVVASFLPVIDNFERALALIKNIETGENSLKEGVEMVLKQLKEVIISFGVEEIVSLGTEFNPELHNAVMHVEDEAYGQNQIIEEFQKGYIYKEKVIRHSVVKVAN